MGAEMIQPDFDAHLARAGHPLLWRGRVSTLQLNIGLKCDLACHHCHVGAGPKRTEMLDRRGVERVPRHPEGVTFVGSRVECRW